MSGSRYLESRMISIFTKSPQPSSRANRAMRTASLALRAPDVFGSRVTPSGIWSRMLSPSALFARRTASVIISAPACCTAASISAIEYFPDPRIKREWNSRPPRISGSFVFGMPIFPSEAFINHPSIKRPGPDMPSAFAQRAKTHFEHVGGCPCPSFSATALSLSSFKPKTRVLRTIITAIGRIGRASA